MKRNYFLALLGIMMLFASQAWSQPLQYVASIGSGAPSDLTGGVTLFTAGQGNRPNWGQNTTGNNAVYSFPIGFNFVFNDVTYTSLWANTNGLVGFGASSTSFDNNLAAAPSYPIITAYWDHVDAPGGATRYCTAINPSMVYRTIGGAPNRMLIIQWHGIELARSAGAEQSCCSGSANFSTWEVRLYETSNKIEFFYEKMASKSCGQINRTIYCMSASSGIAVSPSRFLSISYQNGAPTVSGTFADNGINIGPNGGCGNTGFNHSIPDGQLITFTPCTLQPIGIIGFNNGSPTTQISNGTQFFSGQLTQIGNSKTFRPMYVKMTDETCTRSYSLAITGSSASEYKFLSNNTQNYTRVLSGGFQDTIGIIFTPTGTGVRPATLTITDVQGFIRTVNLVGQAPLVNYTPNVAQGGTALLNTGDTLLNRFPQDRFTTQGYTPFMLTNMSPATAAITYNLTGGGGQYTISAPPPAGIAPGASTTPTITFSPTGFGAVPATLVVTAAGESRTFTLYAVSAAPGGTFTINSVLLDTTTELYNNQYNCLGEAPFKYRVAVTNVGFKDFLIKGIEGYLVDTTYRQGTPRYATIRDANGKLTPITDYFLTDAQTGAKLTFPIVVPQGGNQLIDIAFAPFRPQKRFANFYIRTNGENFSGYDTNNVLKEGVLSFGVYGRGLGSTLSDNAKGGLPKTILFPITKVGGSSQAKINLSNSGECQMRISLGSLRIISGDFKEFTIVQLPTGTIDPVTNDLILPAHTMNATMTVAFTPQSTGSHRASLELRTNDSTVIVPGHTERGVYYLDLFGSSPTILAANSIDLGTALIGGTAADQTHGIIHLENTTNEPLTITKIEIIGTDKTEFIEDVTMKWPTLPKMLLPGERQDIGIALAPAAGGAVGVRSAIAKLTLSNGDSVLATLSGIAGTREISVTPTVMTFDARANSGQVNRQTIAITNTGTMRLHLAGKPQLSASLKGFITVGALPRLELEGGQTEYLEVVYNVNGSTVGSSVSGSLTIRSDATNKPTETVVINATTSKTKRGVDATPTVPGIGNNSGSQTIGIGAVTGSESVSGVENVSEAGGVKLWQSVPNPGRDLVEIRYQLSRGGEVMLSLYDEAGRLVRVLASGDQGSGEQHVRFDVRDLAAGVYHYRLSAEGQVITRSLQIVR